MSSSSSSRLRDRHRRRSNHKYATRYLLGRIIGHHRFIIDEVVNDWRYVKTASDPEISRVIEVNFISGARTAIKLNQINLLYQYSMTVTDPDTKDEHEVHAVEASLNNSYHVRFRFNSPPIINDCVVNEAKENANRFYNELIESINIPIVS